MRDRADASNMHIASWFTSRECFVLVAQEATSLLSDCNSMASEQSEWRTVWQAEAAAVAKERASANVIRETVHFQAVSKQPSKMPAGKQVAVVLPYELPAVDLTLFQL